MCNQQMAHSSSYAFLLSVSIFVLNMIWIVSSTLNCDSNRSVTLNRDSNCIVTLVNRCGVYRCLAESARNSSAFYSRPSWHIKPFRGWTVASQQRFEANSKESLPRGCSGNFLFRMGEIKVINSTTRRSILNTLLYKIKVCIPLVGVVCLRGIRRFSFERNDVDPVLGLLYSPPSAQPAHKQTESMHPHHICNEAENRSSRAAQHSEYRMIGNIINMHKCKTFFWSLHLVWLWSKKKKIPIDRRVIFSQNN